MTISQIIYLLIITTTLIGVAVGRYPKLRMNRATIALVGAAILISINAISLNEAFNAIDMGTLLLLFSMMIINVNLRLSGFFAIITNKVASVSKTPGQLLWLTILSSGLLSALFLNDTIVLVFTPLLLEVTRRLKINPIPYLVALVTAANVGSVATFVGNPQNMIIGNLSGISFSEFSFHLIPIAIIGLSIIWFVIRVVYGRDLSKVRLEFSDEIKIRPYKPLLIKSSITGILMMIAFFSGVPVTLAAFLGAALLLVTRRLKPERVFREIDWSLLVFFASLFVVTHSIQTTGFSERIFNSVTPLLNDKINFTVVSVVLSNLVSNVPAVLLFSDIIPQLQEPKIAWMMLAMATTFAGNLTLIGSVANLIVAETAKSEGVHLSFVEYLKAGIPITMLTLILGVVILTMLS